MATREVRPSGRGDSKATQMNVSLASKLKTKYFLLFKKVLYSWIFYKIIQWLDSSGGLAQANFFCNWLNSKYFQL